MPRDGSGGYTRATPGTPYVSNTTISSTVVNSEMDDLGAEIANSIAADGQKTPTNNLPMGGYKHTGVGNASARAHYAAAGQVQDGAFTAATIGGTANALTFTLSPAPTAYATNMRWQGIATATCSDGATTGNLNSIGDKSIKRPDLTDPLASDIVSGQVYQFTYDGTYIILLNPSRVVTRSASDNSTNEASTAYVDAAVSAAVTNNLSQLSVRQTVLSGPVDSDGLAAFGGATGGTTVTASGTLIATAANGFSTAGGVNRVGSITNPSWSGLSTDGTMYLYLDIASDGTCTAGSTTLAPTYQWGGTYSTSNGQFTFNIQVMVGKVGDGSVASQAYRVFVGEVTVSGGVVSAIVWYQIQSRYRSSAQALPSGNTTTSFSHNLGVVPSVKRAIAICTTAQSPFSVGDEVDISQSSATGGGNTYVAAANAVAARRNTLAYRIPDYGVVVPNSGSFATLDNAKWDIRIEAERGW